MRKMCTFSNAGFLSISLIALISFSAGSSAHELEQELRRGVVLAYQEFRKCEVAGIVKSKSNPELSYPFMLPVGTIFSVSGTRFCVLQYARNGLDVVQAENDRYAFAISKTNSADQYGLTELFARADPAGIGPIEQQRQGLNNFLFAHYQLKIHWLWDVMDDPGFEIKKVERVHADNDGLIKAVFSFVPKRPRLKNREAFEKSFVGYFICDPKKMWAITEYFIKDREDFPYGAVRNIQVEEGHAALPMPTKVVYYGASGNIDQDDKPRITDEWKKRGVEEIEISYSDLGTTDEVFYLSHYGLPEPEFSQTTFGIWLVYFLAATCFLLIGIYVYRKSKSE